jgi:hypothetical protein
LVLQFHRKLLRGFFSLTRCRGCIHEVGDFAFCITLHPMNVIGHEKMEIAPGIVIELNWNQQVLRPV